MTLSERVFYSMEEFLHFIKGTEWEGKVFNMSFPFRVPVVERGQDGNATPC